MECTASDTSSMCELFLYNAPVNPAILTLLGFQSARYFHVLCNDTSFYVITEKPLFGYLRLYRVLNVVTTLLLRWGWCLLF